MCTALISAQLCTAMDDDGEQSHAAADVQQSAATFDARDEAAAADDGDDADSQTAAMDDDNEQTAAAADASNDVSPTGQPVAQASRWRRAGTLPVALPPLSSYSQLTSIVQFPQLLSFLRTFRVSLGLTAFSTLDLLTALTVPSSSPFHVDVVWGLLWSSSSCPFSLRKHKEQDDARMGGAKVDPVRYPPWWQLFVQWWSDEWPQLYDRDPFEHSEKDERKEEDAAAEGSLENDEAAQHSEGSGSGGSGERAVSRGWDGLTAVERCVILEWLCEWKLQQEGEGGLRSEDGSRAAVDELDMDSLRVEPLGYNEQGDAYYYFGHDAFVFVAHRSETEQQQPPTPQKKGRSRVKATTQQPTAPSSNGTAVSTAPALLPQHATPHRWSVLCSTLQEMQQVLPALAETAAEVADWLQENVAEKMASSLERRRGAEERRARMALVPRKRSSRIQMGELRREEEERKEEERRRREEEERQRKAALTKERQRERNRKKREAEAERMREIESELLKERMDALAGEREARQRERERLQLELRMRKAVQERREARRAAANRADGADDDEDNEQDDDDDDAEYGASEDDSEYGNVVKLVSAARLKPNETLQLFSSDNVSAHLKGRHLRVAVKRKGILWPPPKDDSQPEQRRGEEEKMADEDDERVDGKRNGKGKAQRMNSRKQQRKERRKKKQRRKQNGADTDSSSSSSASSSSSSSASTSASSSSSSSSSSSGSDSSPSSSSDDNKRKKRRRKQNRVEDSEAAEKREKQQQRNKNKNKKKKKKGKGKAEDGQPDKQKEKRKQTRKKKQKAAAAAIGSSAPSTSSSSTSSPTAQSAVQQTDSPVVAQLALSPLQQQQQQQQWLLQLAHNAAVQRFQQHAASAATMSPQMQAAAAQQYAAFVYMRQQAEEQAKLQQTMRQQQQQQQQPPQSAGGEQPASTLVGLSLPHSSPDALPSADQPALRVAHSLPVVDQPSEPVPMADDTSATAHNVNGSISSDESQLSTQPVPPAASAPNPDEVITLVQQAAQPEQTADSQAEAVAASPALGV